MDIDPADKASRENHLSQTHPVGEFWSETLPIGLFLISGEGDTLHVNHVLLNMLDAVEDQFLGQSYHRVFQALISKARSPGMVSQSLDAAVLSIKNNPIVEIALRGRPGTHLELCLFSTRHLEGVTSAWGGLLQDRSQERGRLTGQAKLAERIVRKSRKELAAFQGQLRALSNHHTLWDAGMIEDMFQSLNESLQEISGHVEHALDFLRLQNEGIVVYPQKSHIESLIREVLQRVSVQFPALKVNFHLEGELPPARLDPKRVKRVVWEMIRYLNGAHLLEEQLMIRASTSGNWIRVSMGREQALETFHPEEQTSNQAFNKEGGRSDALLISRSVIEAHGGKLWVSRGENTTENGVISFTLPIMPVQRDVRVKEEGKDQDLEKGATILVADSDPEGLTLLTSVFRNEGYHVQAAADGPAIIDIAQADTPDLIILEWDLVGMSGLSATKFIRRWSSLPIFMITSRTNPETMLDAFQAGVDDFITKPFLVDEILARAKALLRRKAGSARIAEADVFERRGLRINYDTRRVWKDGQSLELTPTEYKLLTYMVNHRRQVLPYRQLIEHAWEATEEGSRQGLFVHISRLRQKLEEDPEHPELIVTRWGVGYIFMPE